MFSANKAIISANKRWKLRSVFSNAEHQEGNL